MFNIIGFEQESKYDQLIKKCKSQGVILFGASNYGVLIKEKLKSQEIKIEAFCDNDSKKWGKKIYAFEPDCENYKKLRSFIIENNIEERVVTEEAGLYSNDGVVGFDFVSETGSYISEEGKFKIKTKSIDNYFKDIPITFIKMDIEESEKEALLGGKNVIQRDRLMLAICIYNKPQDLWEIPLIIKEILPQYKIYIRHHRADLYETVCYAVAE